MIPRSTLYTLFMQAPAIICVLRGPEHIFELVNPGYQRLFNKRQLLGLPIREALPEVEGQGFFELLDNVYATGESYTAKEARVLLDRRGDGVRDEAYFNFVYQPMLSQQRETEAIIVFAYDVTTEVLARQQGQEQLRRTEEMFRLLVDSVQDYAIFMLDADGRVASWNEGARRIKGYDAKDVIGRHFSIFFPEDDIQSGMPMHLLNLAREQGRAEAKGWRVRNDGTRFRAHAILTAVQDFDGNLRGFAKVTRDVTDREKAEQTERALLVAQEVNRAKDEFLALISHELRTPLTSILGWSRLLRMGDLDKNEIQEALDALERSTQAQVHLIEDLLDDARISSGKLRLEKRLVEMSSVIEAALLDLTPAAEAKNIVLTTDLQSGNCSIMADPIRLQQIVWNIVSNAIKFTPEKGTVTLRLTREDSFAKFAVTDTGRGIDPKILPQLFQRFRQAEAASSRKAGIGLGLAISKYLVEQHGGRIAAESPGMGKGSTFTIEFPLASETPDQFVSRDKNRAEDLPDLSGIHILLIEDEADNRDVLAKALEFCGAEVQCAESGDAARKLLEQSRPDVVICDIALPDVDGCEFLQEIRLKCDSPALALTVFGSSDEKARIQHCGFDGFRQKPIEPADLAHEVARLAKPRKITEQ